MRTCYSKVLCFSFLCLLLYPLDIVWAEGMRSNFEISKPSVLHTLSGYGKYDDYDSVELFVDAGNHIVALSSFGFSDNDGHAQKVVLFIFSGKTWISSTQVLPGYPTWRGIVNNGVFHAYVVSSPQSKSSKAQTLSIYSLTSDTKLSSRPIDIIEMCDREKVFEHENYRILTELLPLGSTSNESFILGYYVENRLSPVDLIGRVLSAGHYGFVERPFGAIVKQDRITGYYNTPEKLETNERTEITDSVVEGNKLHCVGIRGIEYGDESDKVQYSNFDLSKRQWTEPVKLFKGRKHSENMLENFSPPSLACNKGKVYCVWSWTIIDRSNIDNPVCLKESGVYFCRGTNEAWDKPVKISDFGVQPKVIIDKSGAVYVFWIEENKGLFYKCKTNSDWSNTYLVEAIS